MIRSTLRLIKLIKPYLMADKLESAKYVENIGRSLPDTMLRPMYIGFVEHAFRPAFLYPKYVDFPVKYAIVVREGDSLPRPVRLPYVMRYTREEVPIYWYERMRR